MSPTWSDRRPVVVVGLRFAFLRSRHRLHSTTRTPGFPGTVGNALARFDSPQSPAHVWSESFDVSVKRANLTLRPGRVPRRSTRAPRSSISGPQATGCLVHMVLIQPVFVSRTPAAPHCWVSSGLPGATSSPPTEGDANAEVGWTPLATRAGRERSTLKDDAETQFAWTSNTRGRAAKVPTSSSPR